MCSGNGWRLHVLSSSFRAISADHRFDENNVNLINILKIKTQLYVGFFIALERDVNQVNSHHTEDVIINFILID